MNTRTIASLLLLTAVLLGVTFLLLVGMLDAHLPSELLS